RTFTSGPAHPPPRAGASRQAGSPRRRLPQAPHAEAQHQQRRDPGDQPQRHPLHQRLAAEDAQSRHGPQGQHRAQADGERVVVTGGEVGGHDLGEVAELGDQDQHEARPGDLPEGLVLRLADLLLAVVLAEGEHRRAAQEEQARDHLHELLRQQREDAAGGHREHHVQRERGGDTGEDVGGAVAGAEDESGERGLVGQLGEEDDAEDDGRHGQADQRFLNRSGLPRRECCAFHGTPRHGSTHGTRAVRHGCALHAEGLAGRPRVTRSASGRRLSGLSSMSTVRRRATPLLRSPAYATPRPDIDAEASRLNHRHVMSASLASQRAHSSAQPGVASIPLLASTPAPHKGVRMSQVYARRRLGTVAMLTALIASVGLFHGPAASAALPTPVSAATARGYLSALKVAPEDRTGYNRDLFPHWITISGTCNTRETVLKRDGTNVVTNSSCAATSGSWYSPYDGATWS